MTAPAHRVVNQFEAMGTAFEATLAGDDAEHLEAVAAAVEDEVRRLEGVLSRFDPASEVARVNREAAGRWVRLSVELWELLLACESHREQTGGFDVTAGSASPVRPRLTLDPETRAVRFAGPGVRLDLGGVGKGYALDQAAAILRRFGVTSGLLNGGGSSLLAVGADPAGAPWRVAVRHPLGGDHAPPVGHVALAERAFSCSATRRPGQVNSDIVDPATGQPLAGNAACVVLAPSATTAECLSTALLARRGAVNHLRRFGGPDIDVGWIDAEAESPRIEWLRGNP